jgi:acetyl esterase/lipase
MTLAIGVSILGERPAGLRAAEPEQIRLWQNGAPGNPPTEPADEPLLFLSRPAKDRAVGTAVIVCPGGGYGHLAMDYEGIDVAKWFNTFGVAGFVLKYRHSASGHKHPIPMQDGQRAIRMLRSRAAEWGIDPNRIGVLGFSAGGHLASTLATHFDSGDPRASDPIDRASSRPDFTILCYPVITMMEDYTHAGARDNLLGTAPDKAMLQQLSNELQVTPQTPPTFLFHTSEDTAVPPENSIAFYAAMRVAGVSGELHIYEAGRHGVGLAKDVPGTNTWPERCREWMAGRGYLNADDTR